MYTLLCVALVHTSVRRKCTHYAAVSNPCIISHSESILVRSLNEKLHGVETAALVCVAHVHTIMRCKCTCICAYRACVYTICVFKTYIDISLLVAVGTAGTWETHESSCNNMQSSNKKVYACTACTSVHTYDYHCTQCLASHVRLSLYSVPGNKLQWVAARCIVWRCVAEKCLHVHLRVLTCTPIIELSDLQQVTMSCSALQCVAVCCRSVYMYTYECWDAHLSLNSMICSALQYVAACCSVLQCVAVCCRRVYMYTFECWHAHHVNYVIIELRIPFEYRKTLHYLMNNIVIETI